MTTGWLQLDITYDEATSDDYKYTAAAFNDDEDQTRWFYFKSNGKKIYSESADETKDKTINGKKYAFDQYGAMVAECLWMLIRSHLHLQQQVYLLLKSRLSTARHGDTIIVLKMALG